MSCQEDAEEKSLSQSSHPFFCFIQTVGSLSGLRKEQEAGYLKILLAVNIVSCWSCRFLHFYDFPVKLSIRGGKAGRVGSGRTWDWHW